MNFGPVVTFSSFAKTLRLRHFSAQALPQPSWRLHAFFFRSVVVVVLFCCFCFVMLFMLFRFIFHNARHQSLTMKNKNKQIHNNSTHTSCPIQMNGSRRDEEHGKITPTHHVLFSAKHKATCCRLSHAIRFNFVNQLPFSS